MISLSGPLRERTITHNEREPGLIFARAFGFEKIGPSEITTVTGSCPPTEREGRGISRQIHIGTCGENGDVSSYLRHAEEKRSDVVINVEQKHRNASTRRRWPPK